MIFVAGIKMNRESKLNGNFNLSVGSVSGEELGYEYAADPLATPNTFFKTTLVAVNFDLQYNLVDKENLKVYLSQGIGGIRFQPKDEFGNDLIDQTETRSINEEYRNLTLVLPTMVGVKYLLPNGYGIALQTGLYNTTTDYLDNIGTLGNKGGGDNIWSTRVQVSMPLK